MAVADLASVNLEPAALATVISYVRGPHDAKVATLAERLIRDGVPCDLDLFDPRPPGGWSRWMTEKMTGTDVVLAVCSEPYYKRYHLEEQPGVGKGATFEGGMLGRRVLDAQGSEHGVIPIVFDRADIRFIPEFLRDETYFVLPEQFDDLYRVLTRQPAFVKPPLGQVRQMPPINVAQRDSSAAASPKPARPDPAIPFVSFPLAAFGFADHSFVFGRYSELSREGNVITIGLVVEDDGDAANFRRLQSRSGDIEMVWALDAAVVRGIGYKEVHRDGKQVVEVRFTEQTRRGSSFLSEGSINGISADQIALRRARRILLNERPPETSELGTFSSQRLNEQVLEQYVSGSVGSDLKVKGSTIPLYVSPNNPTSESLEAARLMCVYALLRSNTVERITRLDLRAVANGVVIEFSGVRARVASNVEPTVLSVSGICPLT